MHNIIRVLIKISDTCASSRNMSDQENIFDKKTLNIFCYFIINTGTFDLWTTACGVLPRKASFTLPSPLAPIPMISNLFFASKSTISIDSFPIMDFPMKTMPF